jgi:Ca2+-binding RTX toxin-like protein
MLDLSGDRMSSIKGEHIWVYTQGDEQDYIDSPFWIIAGSLIEKITLNGGQATVYDSAYDEYFEATSSATKAITISQGNDAIKISGSSDDTITLANVDIFWSDAVSAEFSGNAGTGNMDLELTDLTSYLHHTLAVDAGDGQDQLIGTAGNDALFLQDLVVDPNSFWDGDLTANRIISVETITLNAGNDFLDMTSHTSSLTGQQIAISAGDGNDILWLSDADDTVTLGDGNDICIPSLGANNVTLGAGADTIILSAITGSCTLADFNLAEDSISFYGAATTSILDNILTFSGDDFAYEIEFSDISPSIDTIQIDFI